MDLNELFEGTFLEQLKEIDGKCPTEPIAEEETLVGLMEIVERKLFALSQYYAKMGSLLKAKADYDAGSQEEKQSLITAKIEAFGCGKVIKELMWALIRERLSATTANNNIGVREKFQIVTTKDNEGIDIMSILKGEL